MDRVINILFIILKKFQQRVFDISQQYAGGGMNSGRTVKQVENESQRECEQHQVNGGHAWQDENEKEENNKLRLRYYREIDEIEYKKLQHQKQQKIKAIFN